MRHLHLDKHYRRRWQEFHLANGDIKDSREVNWRQVDWPQVVKIVVCIERQRHIFEIQHPSHKFFMNFRWGGSEPVYGKDGKYQRRKPIDLWTVGWTDGVTCYLTDTDFYTGQIGNEYQMPLSELKNHIHPLILRKIDGNYLD